MFHALINHNLSLHLTALLLPQFLDLIPHFGIKPMIKLRNSNARRNDGFFQILGKRQERRMSRKNSIHKRFFRKPFLAEKNGITTSPTEPRDTDFKVGIFGAEDLKEGFDDGNRDGLTVPEKPWSDNEEKFCPGTTNTLTPHTTTVEYIFRNMLG